LREALPLGATVAGETDVSAGSIEGIVIALLSERRGYGRD
jgi:hypothetical protein